MHITCIHPPLINQRLSCKHHECMHGSPNPNSRTKQTKNAERKTWNPCTHTQTHRELPAQLIHSRLTEFSHLGFAKKLLVKEQTIHWIDSLCDFQSLSTSLSLSQTHTGREWDEKVGHTIYIPTGIAEIRGMASTQQPSRSPVGGAAGPALDIPADFSTHRRTFLHAALHHFQS
jgi:hypothetical protein